MAISILAHVRRFSLNSNDDGGWWGGWDWGGWREGDGEGNRHRHEGDGEHGGDRWGGRD